MPRATCEKVTNVLILLLAMLGCESADRGVTADHITSDPGSCNNSTVKTTSDSESTAQFSDQELFTPSVSLIQILAHPNHYRGKKLLVHGFLRVEREGNVVFLSRDDDQYMMACNAFWVSFDYNAMGMSRETIRKDFDGKYVSFVGYFDDTTHGHMGLFQGTFKDVSQLSLALDRTECQRIRDLHPTGTASESDIGDISKGEK